MREATNKRDITPLANKGLRLPDNIFFRTAMLNFLMGRAVAHTYGSEDLQSHEWKVMGVLFSFGPMPASAIVQRVTFDKAAISRALRSLENRELINRQPHRTDGRSARIVMTPEGERTYRRILRQVAALQEEVFATLDAKTVDLLFKAYDSMEDILRARLELPRV